MEHLLENMLCCISDFDQLWKCPYHLDILQTEPSKTLFLSTHKLGRGWFAGWNIGDPTHLYQSSCIKEVFVAHYFHRCWHFYRHNVHLHLAVISVGRLFAVGWPLRHRRVNYRVYICAIIIPWVIAAIFTTLNVFCQLGMIGFGKYFYAITLISGTPLLIICVANYAGCLEKVEIAFSPPESC